MIVPHSRPTITEHDIDNVVLALRSGHVSDGVVVESFERAVSEYIGVLGGVAVNSGTSALHLASRALGIGPGDEVILPSYVCASVLHAVNLVGATPVFADIECGSYNIDPESVVGRRTSRTRAVIAPHLFGVVANLDGLLDTGLPVIEDCAQAIGAEYRGSKVGSWGAMGVLSFKATKLMTTGHGGMVVTNSQKLLRNLRELTKYDELDEYQISPNYLMSDLQAALGLSQLARLDSFVERRREIARVYDRVFDAIGVSVRRADAGVFYRYIVEVDDAKRYVAATNRGAVACAQPIFRPLHDYSAGGMQLPNTAKAMRRLVSIPIYPSLTEDEIEHVCKIVEAVWTRTQNSAATSQAPWVSTRNSVTPPVI